MARRDRAGDVVLALGCAGLGLVLPVALGIDPVLTTAVFAGGVAAGTATGPLSGGGKFAAFFILFLAGIVALGAVDRTDSGGSWCAGMVLGAVLGVVLAGRVRSPAGPALHGSHPGAAPALRARWDDGPESVEPEAPATATLLDAVRSLDGRERTIVSIARGQARLDIGGSSDGALLVLFCDGVDARLPRWQALAHAPGGPAASEVVVRIAGMDGHVPEDVTTTLGPALEAVEHFAATGARVPEHAWRSDARTGDLRPPALDGAGAL